METAFYVTAQFVSLFYFTLINNVKKTSLQLRLFFIAAGVNDFSNIDIKGLYAGIT